jgi:hypothetical protein
MAEAIKISQAAIAVADTEQSLYVVPASTETVISSIVICNRGSNKATYRWAIVPGGGAAGDANWQEYDSEVDGNVSEFRTLGCTLPAAAEVRIRADTTDISFSIYYVEVS